MRIGDAAAAAGTTPRALRFYEQRGLLAPPVRTTAGQREYGQADVDRIRLIRRLLALGLTVEDVRACAARLELVESTVFPATGKCGDPSGVVHRRIDLLDAEIARLTELRDRLAEGVSPQRGRVGPSPG